MVGAGMMGRGIAACIAAGGPHEVRLVGRTAASAQDGVSAARGLVGFLVENGVAASEVGQIASYTDVGEAVAGAQFVFESIVEDLEAKRTLFAQLATLAGADAVLCTNTSSLSVSAIAAGCPGAAASRVVAAHFIGPAHLVPLVEVCPSDAAAAADCGPTGPVDKVVQFLSGLGKKPVILKKEIDGFIAARLQAALYREAMHLVQSGVADCAAVDSAVLNGFGRRLTEIGPFIQADFAGVDLTQRTHATFFPQLGRHDRDLRADALVPEGRLGVKALRGHYEWSSDEVRDTAARRDAELLRRLKVDRDRGSRSGGAAGRAAGDDAHAKL